MNNKNRTNTIIIVRVATLPRGDSAKSRERECAAASPLQKKAVYTKLYVTLFRDDFSHFDPFCNLRKKASL